MSLVNKLKILLFSNDKECNSVAGSLYHSITSELLGISLRLENMDYKQTICNVISQKSCSGKSPYLYGNYT